MDVCIIVLCDAIVAHHEFLMPLRNGEHDASAM